MDAQQTLDDGLLVVKIIQQDQTALSALYDRYAPVLYSVAYRILGSIEEAEEVILDVFAQVWRSARSYDRNRGRVDTWLFTLTRSRALDRLRALQRMAKAVSASEDAAWVQSSPTNDPTEHVMISERRARVVAALNQLPEEQRLVLELAYYKGLTHVEIAAQTGYSLGTVKTRIRLGLNKLRSALAPF